MRASLFLSSLFVVSMISGVALAEKSSISLHRERASRVTEAKTREVRARGDVLNLTAKSRSERSARAERACAPGSAGCGRAERGSSERTDKARASAAAEKARGRAIQQKIQKMLCEKKVTNCVDSL